MTAPTGPAALRVLQPCLPVAPLCRERRVWTEHPDRVHTCIRLVAAHDVHDCPCGVRWPA